MKKYNKNKHILLYNFLAFTIIISITISTLNNINSSISKAANNTFTLNPSNSSDNNNDYNVYKIHENTPKPQNKINNNSKSHNITNGTNSNPKSNNITNNTNSNSKSNNVTNSTNSNSKSHNITNNTNSNSKSHNITNSTNNNFKSNNNTNKLHKNSNKNVRLKSSIKITKLELSSHLIKLPKGKTTSVSVIVTPTKISSKNLIWKSLDTNIAIVKNGNITGIKKGFTTIYVSSKDETVKAACSVKII